MLQSSQLFSHGSQPIGSKQFASSFSACAPCFEHFLSESLSLKLRFLQNPNLRVGHNVIPEYHSCLWLGFWFASSIGLNIGSSAILFDGSNCRWPLLRFYVVDAWDFRKTSRAMPTHAHLFRIYITYWAETDERIQICTQAWSVLRVLSLKRLLKSFQM